jgi:hypothetical protein
MPGTQKIVKPAEARALEPFDASGAAECAHGEAPNPQAPNPKETSSAKLQMGASGYPHVGKRPKFALFRIYSLYFALQGIPPPSIEGERPGAYALSRHFTPLYAWLAGAAKRRVGVSECRRQKDRTGFCKRWQGYRQGCASLRTVRARLSGDICKGMQAFASVCKDMQGYLKLFLRVTEARIRRDFENKKIHISA